MRFVLLALRAALGAVFAVSGFQKLVSPAQNFAAVVEQYEIVSGPAAMLVARTLPWCELVFGALFLAGLRTRASLFALWSLNTVFIGLLASALLRKLPIEQCGCFGEKLTLTPVQMLAFDAGVWALFLFFFLFYRRFPPLSLDDRL